MASLKTKISSFFFNFPSKGSIASDGNLTGRVDSKRSLENVIMPVQFLRAKEDVASWKDAATQVEDGYPYLRYRTRMQRLYMNTVQNAHVRACMQKRMNLTLLKNFSIVDENGKEIESVTKMLDKQWFHDYRMYLKQAQAFGYSLIDLGDLVNNEFPNISIIRRQNVHPDMEYVMYIPDAPIGTSFMEDPYVDWYVWVPTQTELGVSKCGYGYLYTVSLYEIFIRNILRFNNDAAELYGMPILLGSTNKDGKDRDEFFEMLKNAGSNKVIVKNAMEDMIELLDSKNSGKGYLIYSDLDKRCKDDISKLILGHANALDEVPGKIGAGQGKDNPVFQALEDITTIDTRFEEYFTTNVFFPKLRKLGFDIPKLCTYKLKNDAEEEELREKEDQSNLITATLYKMIHDAGGKPDWKYFAERTGIDVEEAPAPQPLMMQNDATNNPKGKLSRKEKLMNLYK